MKSENLIHIRLGTDEAVRAKRGLLSTELSMVKIAHFVRAYKELRMKELELKLDLDKKIRDLKNTERVIRGILPKLKIPSILEKKEEKVALKEIKIAEEKAKKEKGKHQKTLLPKAPKEKPVKRLPADSLEAQLAEIQSRLNQLG